MDIPENKIINYKSYFKTFLSFNPLIKIWERQYEKKTILGESHNYISSYLEKYPELRKIIKDESLVEKHIDFIKELLKICISPTIDKFDYFAALYPDRLECFYQTPLFKKLGIFENQMNQNCFNDNCCITSEGRTIAAYCNILSLAYKFNLSYEYPIVYTYIDEKTGLERYFRIRIYPWFTELKMPGDLKNFTENELRLIYDNLDNPENLTSIFPLTDFVVEGFFIFNAVEVTDLEIISSLKFDLIGKESLMSPEKFDLLEHKLKALLKKKQIRLGMISFPTEKKDLTNALKMGSSIIMDEKVISKNLLGQCSLYDEVIKNKELFVIYDIKNFGCSEEIENTFVNSGIRNLMIAPLIYRDELIGIMEIGSPVPGDLNKVNALKLAEVFPMFAICVEACIDDLYKTVQSVIKEKCTSVHPSVEWKFKDAAMRYLEKKRNKVEEDMEEIVFENVIPFFGSSDIKDSSIYRIEAIKQDLQENLNSAKTIISEAEKITGNPFIEDLSFRISNQLKIIESGITPHSEIDVMNFVYNDIENALGYLKNASPGLDKMIKEYSEANCNKNGAVFKRRNEFDESISRINKLISTELAIQQKKAQSIIPHYFEKQKSDGIEYNMYAGTSIACNLNVSEFHIKSLRIWQLETMCMIARKCIEVKNELKFPMDVTHLIYVQNIPIAIKFFYDEKRFDVAGSFDTRYEIIKKRISKAELKDSKQRLVQPGKIAIVYLQNSDAAEYQQYLNFLKSKNIITDEVETCELQDMHGVQGLKALRFSVLV